MNRIHLVAVPVFTLFLLSAIGCGGSAEKKLIGKWEVDTEQMKAAAKAEMEKQSGEEPGAEMGAALMEGMLANMKMTMEFKEDGTCTFLVSMMGQEQAQEGTWKVATASGNDVTLEIALGDEAPEQGSLTFVDDNTIEMIPPEDQKETMPPGMEKLTLKHVPAFVDPAGGGTMPPGMEKLTLKRVQQ